MLYTLRKMEQKTVDQEMQGKRKKNFKKKEKKGNKLEIQNSSKQRGKMTRFIIQ